MDYKMALRQAQKLSLENKDKHYCIVVECIATKTVCGHNYTIQLGNKDGSEPHPEPMNIDQACAGSLFNGELWGF